MEKPLVSVVLCTYNTERFIAEAINSVLNQNYKNFEFIIWDDGSTDKTREVVESFKDNRIRYVYHENTGLGRALSLACAQAKGKYIARMDSDDICLPNRFDKQVDFLETHKDYVLVSSAVYYINENGSIIGRSFPCSDDIVIKTTLSRSSMITHPMVMMRREQYLQSGGYLSLYYCEDRIFWSRLAKYGKFYNISTPLGKYRLLQNSLGHSQNPYCNILYEFRGKMIRDEEILDSDIELYNHIYKYSKSFIVKSAEEGKKQKKNIDECCYNFLSIFLGKRKSEIIIVWLKNLYYKLKLSIQ